MRPSFILLAGLFGCRATQPEPAAHPVHLIAEWEPAIGAMIAWPLYVPDARPREGCSVSGRAGRRAKSRAWWLTADRPRPALER
jgi:hypothetical protein